MLQFFSYIMTTRLHEGGELRQYYALTVETPCPEVGFWNPSNTSVTVVLDLGSEGNDH